ncbi:MAG: MGMT family protein, partial [Solirubrobacterales bacterium]
MKAGGARLGPRERDDGFFSRVYEAVRSIPRGRVATYGQIAHLLGVPRGARAVGWALRALRGGAVTRVPWHRVVGAGGRISLRGGSGPFVQRKRLQAEGVRFHGGRIELRRYGLPLGFRPGSPEAASGSPAPAAAAGGARRAPG